jgi:hypothetical protein
MASRGDGRRSAEKHRMGCVRAWNGRPVGGVVWDRGRGGGKKKVEYDKWAPLMLVGMK